MKIYSVASSKPHFGNIIITVRVCDTCLTFTRHVFVYVGRRFRGKVCGTATASVQPGHGWRGGGSVTGRRQCGGGERCRSDGAVAKRAVRRVGGGANGARFSSPATRDACQGLWSCTRSAAGRSTTAAQSLLRSRRRRRFRLRERAFAGRHCPYGVPRAHTHAHAPPHIPVGRKPLLSEYRREVIVGRVWREGGSGNNGRGRADGSARGRHYPTCVSHSSRYIHKILSYI